MLLRKAALVKTKLERNKGDDSDERSVSGSPSSEPTDVEVCPASAGNAEERPETFGIVVPRYSKTHAINAWRFGSVCRVKDDNLAIAGNADSFLTEWNLAKTGKQLRIGDIVLKINSKTFLQEMAEEVASGEALVVTLQRSPRFLY